uniref:Phosphatidylinositol-glycan biosynthesis class X protein n=1 Tax=Magallana gigas TaxID=29159 RepID=K1Q6E3_MAGGI
MPKARKSVVEEYDEKTALLDDILELKEEEEKVKETEKEKKSADDQKGKDVRKRALENLSKDEEENQTPKKRTSSTNVMEYLQTKVNIENENKREELKLRSEELRLERERFELEREERRERIETEKKEKAFMLQLLEKIIMEVDLFMLVVLGTAITAAVSSSPNLYRTVRKNGFHRELFTKIFIPTSLIDAKCECLIEEQFPPGLYIDPYELKNYREKGGPQFDSPAVDIEKPKELSPNLVFIIYPQQFTAIGPEYVTNS